MSDLISRDAAIAAIETARQAFALPDDVPGSRLVNAGFAATRGAVEKVPSAPEWVSVKDKLPEPFCPVLVCEKKRAFPRERGLACAFVDKRGDWYWAVLGGGRCYEVPHGIVAYWMNLDLPYQPLEP